MKCPVCKDVTLVMAEKKGIEIDYCPNCRGVWLDRGELEKLIQAEKGYMDEESRNQERYREQAPYPVHDGGYHKDYRHHRKKGFLESFDFFD